MGSVWAQYGLSMGSVWAQYGLSVGSVWAINFVILLNNEEYNHIIYKAVYLLTIDISLCNGTVYEDVY